jgi:5-methylcytosine-specific restriction endonuclease McrA
VIRLTRDNQEPAALALERVKRLPAARAAIAAQAKVAFTGYQEAKPQLFKDQHGKCAYCEKRLEQASYYETEHYRPKDYYWWLAWTWENLLFACFECNRMHKGTQFPLEDETARLVAEAPPPGTEAPLLIDPFDTSIDARDHIVFRRDVVQRRERWRPYGSTPRGEATIRICGLDRASLIDRYSGHVNDFIRPRVSTFHNVCSTEQTKDIVAAWSTLVRGVFAKGQEYLALSRDAVAYLVSSELRARYQLRLS